MTDPRDTAAMNGDTWRYNEGLDAILNAQILAKRDHEARNLTYELAYKDMIVAYDKALERCAELSTRLTELWTDYGQVVDAKHQCTLALDAAETRIAELEAQRDEGRKWVKEAHELAAIRIAELEAQVELAREFIKNRSIE